MALGDRVHEAARANDAPQHMAVERNQRNLEASVRSRDTDVALRSQRELIEAGLN
jgi:hypothetical protein